jgi:hypothetical protein
MHVLGFTGGAHCDAGHRQRLLDAGASSVFCDMSELPSLVEKVNALS